MVEHGHAGKKDHFPIYSLPFRSVFIRGVLLQTLRVIGAAVPRATPPF
jgi:hypothetical protein